MFGWVGDWFFAQPNRVLSAFVIWLPIDVDGLFCVQSGIRNCRATARGSGVHVGGTAPFT